MCYTLTKTSSRSFHLTLLLLSHRRAAFVDLDLKRQDDYLYLETKLLSTGLQRGARRNKILRYSSHALPAWRSE